MPETKTATGTWTEKEIRQQPECWSRSLNHIDNIRQTLDQFLSPLLQKDDLRIVLTGAGTSAFIGDIIAPWLSRHTGKNFSAIPTTDLVTNPMDYLSPAHPLLLVSFARSGNSPESVAAVELANQFVPECYHLSITCNEAGSLYKNAVDSDNAFALLMPAETHDRGFAMTSSITTMMASCLAVFAQDTINSNTFQDVADRCQSILSSLSDFSQGVFGEKPWKRIVYLGSGGLQAAARESALKVLELTAGKVVAFYDSQNGPHILLPASRTFLDVELAFCFLIYAQVFALTQSINVGNTPDTPSASGTVNRVVQGVVIHPWQTPRSAS
ncbi:putative tagatose-6-phosphate ketose/aldose isomerase [compost metagenome]